ncbi:hypothetical protein [Nocardia sp. NPDC059239]|uniref:hypothetical protein n=1 Tax=unclassified Nocardia TaxID=2637762 RepID=UPI003678665B
MNWIIRRSQPPAAPPATPAVPPWEDAKLAMTEFGNWIKNADTKVTILTAALGILVASTASNIDTLHAALSNPAFRHKWILSVPLGLLCCAILATAGFAYQALKPRSGGASTQNRFSWPSVADSSCPPSDLDPMATLVEAWTQNHALARIAALKYRAFANALRCFGIALILSGTCIAIATWQA